MGVEVAGRHASCGSDGCNSDRLVLLLKPDDGPPGADLGVGGSLRGRVGETLYACCACVCLVRRHRSAVLQGGASVERGENGLVEGQAGLVARRALVLDQEHESLSVPGVDGCAFVATRIEQRAVQAGVRAEVAVLVGRQLAVAVGQDRGELGAESFDGRVDGLAQPDLSATLSCAS